MSNSLDKLQPPLILHFGSEALIIHQRYETLSIVNDFLIGLIFLIGSIMFFYPDLTKIGVWLFVIGSIQMLIRPIIRFSHRVHLQKYRQYEGVLSQTDL
ncbi:YrhK family protein [Otariodibacter oris]|nr:YrhK family protein [Otariodibacter oris]QGM81459.1 hypothetical protein A6A10_08585 [Otariodibacter oris]